MRRRHCQVGEESQQAQLSQVNVNVRGVQILFSSPIKIALPFLFISFHSVFHFHQHNFFSFQNQPTTPLYPTTTQDMPATLKHDSNTTTTTTTPVATMKEENILHQAWHSLEEVLHLREPAPPPGTFSYPY